MAPAIGLRAARRSTVTRAAVRANAVWNPLFVARRFVSSHPSVPLDAPPLGCAQLVPPLQLGASRPPWAWDPNGVRSLHSRHLSQLVASRGSSKRLCLVDTLALVRPLVFPSEISRSTFSILEDLGRHFGFGFYDAISCIVVKLRTGGAVICKTILSHMKPL